MCLMHDTSHGISRRGFGFLLAGAAGLSLLPLPARAATVDTLCVTCIDYRFVMKDVTWLNTHLGLAFNNYDIVALAGAALAATVQDRVPQNPQALFDQLKLAKTLHTIKRVILLDHMDCGAYKTAFDDDEPGEGVELGWHKTIMPLAVREIDKLGLDVEVEGYLMFKDGLPLKLLG
ncbi:MAG TPA: carbonic anhydrase [Rhizomicrobium sp.]